MLLKAVCSFRFRFRYRCCRASPSACSSFCVAVHNFGRIWVMLHSLCYVCVFKHVMLSFRTVGIGAHVREDVLRIEWQRFCTTTDLEFTLVLTLLVKIIKLLFNIFFCFFFQFRIRSLLNIPRRVCRIRIIRKRYTFCVNSSIRTCEEQYATY